MSVMLTEASEFAKLVLQAVKNDLASRLELNVCLALNCVANIGGKEMTAAVAPEIQRLLVAEFVLGYKRSFPAIALTPVLLSTARRRRLCAKRPPCASCACSARRPRCSPRASTTPSSLRSSPTPTW